MSGTGDAARNGRPARLELSVSCGSRREWIDPMQAVAERVFRAAGFDEEQSYWPILAVREAVMNAVLHGNRERPDTSVTVTYRVLGDRIEVTVCDEGEGFDPERLRDPRKRENLLSEGGRGVFLMRQFMDRVEFSFPPGGGTCILLVKRLPGASESEGAPQTGPRRSPGTEGEGEDAA